jgi:hypothetical protein
MKSRPRAWRPGRSTRPSRSSRAAPTASAVAPSTKATTPDLLTAKAADEDGAGAILTLTYRRGGGALEMALIGAGERPTTPHADWTAAFAGAPPFALKADANGAARALLPRARFCALGGAGRVAAQPPTGKPLAFDLTATTAALLAEACP